MESRTPKEVLDLARSSEAQFVDLRFCDLPGIMQHFSMPIHELTEDGFEEGYGFDGSSIRGFQEIQESDMLLIPDPDTAVLDPFREHNTINLNCFVRDPVTGESYSRDPRYVAKKAEDYVRGTGIADTAYFGPEAEFYIFDQVRFDQNQHSGYYFVDSSEGVWGSGREYELDGSPNLGYKPGTRRATSRSPRWTATRTCAPRWCRSWSRSGSRSRSSTTRSARPVKPRSTCGSTPC
jgi:glutamine synthetase